MQLKTLILKFSVTPNYEIYEQRTGIYAYAGTDGEEILFDYDRRTNSPSNDINCYIGYLYYVLEKRYRISIDAEYSSNSPNIILRHMYLAQSTGETQHFKIEIIYEKLANKSIKTILNQMFAPKVKRTATQKKSTLKVIWLLEFFAVKNNT